MVVTLVWLLVALSMAVFASRALAERSRRQFLERYRLPDPVLARFRARRPELGGPQEMLVQQGLLQYFEICRSARGKFVSMPSQVADDLWHEFILFTRNYEYFCQKAFGRYLHHTPVEAMSGPAQATAGIRRTWLHACRIEGIDPKHPMRLPLLFALDAQLGIANGFFYTLNCGNTATSSSNTFCASSIGCGTSSGCGGGTSCGSSVGHGGGSDVGSSCGSSCGGGGD